MLCKVYRTHDKGTLLPRARWPAVVGDMRIRERAHPSGIQLATLLAPDGETYLIPCLDRCTVTMEAGHLVIEGREIHVLGHGNKNPKTAGYPQTWKCLVLPAVPIIKLPVVEWLEKCDGRS